MNNFESLLAESGEFGVVEQTFHPIVIVAGLPNARLNELVTFENGQMGQVFMLERYSAQILLLGNESLRIGMKVARSGKFISTPVGNELLGHIIDPLGNPLRESKSYVRPSQERDVDIAPSGIMTRAKIKEQFLTGVAVVDMMVPLGKGQKELVIGDRKTGKSSFLLAAIKNQVKNGAIAIYAAVAKKKSDIKKIEQFLEREKLLDKVIVIATTSNDSPTLIYLTPYSAMTVAEYFRDQGQDVVLVLDDLSTHAKFYREISLLAKKFPGRDSYPGDIFYTHARLLERAGNFVGPEGKAVAITALPVAETVEGDFTGYIATNLMGITDGHIFFDSNIYYRGRRPAVNVSLSVTRVGRQATTNLLRSINREITAFLALYDKMQNLSHFGAELTDSVKYVIRTGEMIYKFFEQPNAVVVPQEVQVILFSALWLTILEDVTIDKLMIYRQNLINAYYNREVQQLFKEIMDAKTFNDLLNNVNKKREEIKALCITNTQ